MAFAEQQRQPETPSQQSFHPQGFPWHQEHRNSPNSLAFTPQAAQQQAFQRPQATPKASKSLYLSELTLP